jgi:tetratricopeptide (TPR) repeat protein
MNQCRPIRLPVARSRILSVFLIVFPVLPPSPARQASPQANRQFQARDLLGRGVEAFKNAQYDEAEQDFLRAKELDPELVNARLYLATTYASQYIPGAPSRENRRRGQAAVEEFKELLALNPQNLSAIDGLGSILFQMAGTPFDPDLFRESKSCHQKHIDLRPLDPEPHFWIGVIDWTLAFRGNAQYRAEYNLSPRGEQLNDNEPLPEDLRQVYAREYGSIIEEGISSMKRALELRPDYDDAMAYLNLLYRRKGDIATTPAEREVLTQLADELIDKVKEIKEKRAGQPQ